MPSTRILWRRDTASGSDMVVEGHFQQTGGMVLVRWRLLRTDNGTALDADEWEGDADSMLHLPGRLANSPVQALGITPSAGERERIGRTDTSNPEAFRHYLLGRAHLEARSVARAAEAECEFRAALALDPAYARAHAGLALTLTHQAWLGAVRGIDVMEPARHAALEALAHDGSIALAHTVLAIVHELFDHDPISAQAAHVGAMARDDEDLWVLRTYGMFLLRHAAFDEALELSTRTLVLDPTSPLSNRHRAQTLYAARRYDECIAVSRDTLLLDPHDVSLVLNWLPMPRGTRAPPRGGCEWSITRGCRAPALSLRLSNERSASSFKPSRTASLRRRSRTSSYRAKPEKPNCSRVSKHQRCPSYCTRGWQTSTARGVQNLCRAFGARGQPHRLRGGDSWAR